jgi:chorismate mutase
MVKAVRGAVSLESDTQQELILKVEELYSKLLQKNGISEEDIISILFSQTKDISYNPAKALRLAKEVADVPLFCTQEAVCMDFPQERMLRVLVTFNTDQKAKTIIPVYLGRAADLRGDLKDNGTD